MIQENIKDRLVDIGKKEKKKAPNNQWRKRKLQIAVDKKIAIGPCILWVSNNN